MLDGFYVMAWIEDACNGTLGAICFKQRTMHEAGFGFHVGWESGVLAANEKRDGRWRISALHYRSA